MHKKSKKKNAVVKMMATSVIGAAMILGGCAGAGLRAENVEAVRDPVAEVKRPNVLFIIADDMNTRLGTYGAPVATPNIDRLAQEGTRFDRAYTQWPVCGASRASFLTGRRPDVIGQEVVYERFRCTIPNAVTLPQFFRENGYFSARVGKVFHQGVPSDIGRDGDDDPASWDVALNPAGVDKTLEKDVINFTPGLGLGRANAILGVEAPEEDFTDGKVATAAIELMREHQDKPFFLAVGFYRPHVPEIAPQKYFDRYPASEVRLAEETEATLAAVPEYTSNSNMVHLGMTEEQQRRMIAAYQAATSHMDAQVGRVLDELDRLGLADDTIVVFVGDHGFMLGEHGQWQKTLMWEESIRVPMIIRDRGRQTQGAVTQVVEMLDIFPTLTELAGFKRPSSLDGDSLVQLMNGDAAGWDNYAFSQIWGAHGVNTERWHYIEWEHGKLGRQLFDHSVDPREHNNLADDPAYAPVVARLSAMLPKAPAEKRGAKTLSNPQTPPKRFGSRPDIQGCEDLERLIG